MFLPGEWIPGFEGRYRATKDGEIWSMNKKGFLKSFTQAGGYPRVVLQKDGDHMNAKANNLEWSTPKENSRHAVETRAYFPLRPDQKHLLDGLRLMIDTVRASVPTRG